jgi:hypothetical protein
MKRKKEGDYGWGTFYTFMNMENWNLLKLSQEGEWGKREINGGGAEPNQGTIYVCMEMSQCHPCITILY